jgi:hypothetical protein
MISRCSGLFSNDGNAYKSRTKFPPVRKNNAREYKLDVVFNQFASEMATSAKCVRWLPHFMSEPSTLLGKSDSRLASNRLLLDAPSRS